MIVAIEVECVLDLEKARQEAYRQWYGDAPIDIVKNDWQPGWPDINVGYVPGAPHVIRELLKDGNTVRVAMKAMYRPLVEPWWNKLGVEVVIGPVGDVRADRYVVKDRSEHSMANVFELSTWGKTAPYLFGPLQEPKVEK